MTILLTLILSIVVLYFLPNVTFVGPIMRQMGLNETAPYLAVLFGISLFFIKQFMLKPYLANLEYRKKNTGGSVDEAAQLNQAAERLAMDYQGQVKKQNEQVAAIYDTLKKQGQEEEDRLVSKAREEADVVLDQARQKITTEMKAASENLRAQIPQLSQLIASRVLGREL